MVVTSASARSTLRLAEPVRLLLIDDEADTLLPVLVQNLEPLGFAVVKEADGARALQALTRIAPDVVLLDLHFPGDDDAGATGTTGGRLLTEIRRRFGSIPVVVFTTRLDDVDVPLETFEERPHGYFAKPDFERDSEWARYLARAMHDAIALARHADHPDTGDLGFVVGQTPEMREAAAAIRTAAANALTVLIYGETGTGKQRAAEAIHRLSGRTGRFEHYNCAGAHPETLDSTLFGHERGAFTGATAPKPGLFELANGGTLFLDEIQGMPAELQNRLVTAVESGTVRRMGATVDKAVNVRLVVATNHNLSDLVADGVLREDLAYRLASGMLISLPPLRQRMGDLPALFETFVARANEATGRRLSTVLRPETAAKLRAHVWHGNIRELESTLVRAVATSRSNVLLPEDIEFVGIGRPRVEERSDPSPKALPAAPAPATSAMVIGALTDQLEAMPIAERYQFLKNQGPPLRREILVEFICRLRRRTGRRVQHKTLAAELDPLIDVAQGLNRIRQFLHASDVRLTLLDCNQ